MNGKINRYIALVTILGMAVVSLAAYGGYKFLENRLVNKNNITAHGPEPVIASSSTPEPVPVIEPTAKPAETPGISPTLTPSPIPVVIPSPTLTPTPEPLPAQEDSPTPEPTAPPEISPTAAPTPTPIQIVPPKNSSEIEPTPTPAPVASEPVFAEPDLEFEKEINSSKSDNFIEKSSIGLVKDGKIFFDTTHDCQEGDPLYSHGTLIPVVYDSEINKVIYEIVRDLYYYAKQTNGYVEAYFNPESYGDSRVSVNFFLDKDMGTDINRYTQGYYMFRLDIYISPQKSFYTDSDNIVYRWDIHKLHSSDFLLDQGFMGRSQEEDLTKFEYIQDCYADALGSMLKNVYGKTQGYNIFQFVLTEYIKAITSKEFFAVNEIGIREDFGGCEFEYVRHANEYTGIDFFTSKVGVKK